MEYAPLRESRNMGLINVPRIDTPVTDIAGRISPRLNNKGQVEGTSDRMPTISAHSTTTSMEESSAELQRQSSVEISAGSSRPSMHGTTLKELAAASPRKPTASLEQQLAELQHDLKAKQAEVDAGRADLEHRQRLLRFAAGAARREVLELRAYKEKADAALVIAEQRIEELRQDLDAVAAKMKGSKLGKEQQIADNPGNPSSTASPPADKISDLSAQAVEQEPKATEALAAPASDGLQLAELRAQLEAEAGVKLQLEERVQHLETQVAAKEEQCASLEAELSAVAAAAVKAQDRVRILEPEVTALAAQAEHAGQQLAEATKEREALEEECAQLRLQAQGGAPLAAQGEPFAAPELAAVLEQRTTALQAAEQRSRDATAEIETLMSSVAKHREEIEELKGSLAEVEKQVDGERGAHAALWEKLQQANDRLSASATEAVARDNEFERRLGTADYRRQCTEAQLRDALSSLKGMQVLALASSVAMTGKVEAAKASQKAVATAAGALAEEMLAVERDLRLFATSEDSISTEVFLEASPASSHAKSFSLQATESVSGEVTSSPSHDPLEAQKHGFTTPGAKAAAQQQITPSTGSSISFIKGVVEREGGIPRASSAPPRQPPRLHLAAVAARRWLHGQISPPRQHLPLHLRSPWLPAHLPAPLLQPTGHTDLDLTPRLTLRDHGETVLASSENPMLLLETPQGPGGPERGWASGPPAVLPRQAMSCPATPASAAQEKCLRPGSQGCEAFPLTGAPPGQPKSDTWRSVRVRRVLFQKAAALADMLESLRLQVQGSLVEPAEGDSDVGGTPSGACDATSRRLQTIEEAHDDSASTGRASVASSIAPRHASSDDDSQDEQISVRERASAGGVVTPMGLLKGFNVPARRQISPDSATRSSSVLVTAPDLHSRPPRLQKLAQATCISPATGTIAVTADASLPEQAASTAIITQPTPVVDQICVSTPSVPCAQKEKAKKKGHSRLRKIAGSLVAVPLLTLAVVASPGIGHWVALAAATVASKDSQKRNKVRVKLSGDKQALNQRGESEYGRRAAIFG